MTKAAKRKSQWPCYRASELLDPATIAISDSNPREKVGSPGELMHLGESIEQLGQLAEVLVLREPAPAGNGEPTLTVIDGERRVRAARAAGRSTLRCRVFEGLTPKQLATIRDAANRERRDLDYIEDCKSLQALADVGYTVAEIAEHARCSKATVRRKLNLLGLPDDVLDLVRKGKLAGDTAAVLCKPLAAEQRGELARRIVRENLDVKEARELVRRAAGPELPGVNPDRPAAEPAGADARATREQPCSTPGFRKGTCRVCGARGGAIKEAGREWTDATRSLCTGCEKRVAAALPVDPGREAVQVGPYAVRVELRATLTSRLVRSGGANAAKESAEKTAGVPVLEAVDGELWIEGESVAVAHKCLAVPRWRPLLAALAKALERKDAK